MVNIEQIKSGNIWATETSTTTTYCQPIPSKTNILHHPKTITVKVLLKTNGQFELVFQHQAIGVFKCAFIVLLAYNKLTVSGMEVNNIDYGIFKLDA